MVVFNIFQSFKIKVNKGKITTYQINQKIDLTDWFHIRLVTLMNVLHFHRNLKGNPLNCNCETKRFRDWVILRTGQVTVLDALCANKNNPLFDVKDFGVCKG